LYQNFYSNYDSALEYPHYKNLKCLKGLPRPQAYSAFALEKLLQDKSGYTSNGIQHFNAQT